MSITEQPRTVEEVKETLAVPDKLNEIVPWCGVGCLSCYIYLNFPDCFGNDMHLRFSAISCCNKIPHCPDLCSM